MKLYENKQMSEDRIREYLGQKALFFSVLAGWALLGETLTLREIGGCALVFIAILLAQMPERK